MVHPPTSKFLSPDVVRMFPSFVWKAELRPDVYGPLNEVIARKLGELRAPLGDLASGESWQSDQALHELDELGGLVVCIDEAAATVLDYLKISHDGFAITGCWANMGAPGAAHRAHSHPNNYLSGVYYVRTHEGANTVNFHDPRPQTGIIRPPVMELTAENTDQVVIRVNDGTLLLFPAWLQHSVDPSRSAHTRISVSFNIMFASYAETMARPLWGAG